MQAFNCNEFHRMKFPEMTLFQPTFTSFASRSLVETLGEL